MISRRSTLFMASFAVVLAGALTGCKKDDPQPAIEYKTDGSITGKITGTSKDNAYTFNDDFSYSEYSLLTGAYASYTVNTDGSYDFELARADYSSIGKAEISFSLTNAADTTPDDIEVAVSYDKEVDNKIVTFSMDSDNGSNTVSITEFTFDVSSGKVTGKYTMSGTSNSTNKSATVAGDFQVTTKRVTQ